MELLVLIGLLVLLALLAPRYGRDSRDWRPGAGLLDSRPDAPRGTSEVAMLELLYPELALERIAVHQQEAAEARELRRGRVRQPGRGLHRLVAFQVGAWLVRLGELLVAIGGQPMVVRAD